MEIRSVGSLLLQINVMIGLVFLVLGFLDILWNLLYLMNFFLLKVQSSKSMSLDPIVSQSVVSVFMIDRKLFSIQIDGESRT